MDNLTDGLDDDELEIFNLLMKGEQSPASDRTPIADRHAERRAERERLRETRNFEPEEYVGHSPRFEPQAYHRAMSGLVLLGIAVLIGLLMWVSIPALGLEPVLVFALCIVIVGGLVRLMTYNVKRRK